MNNELDLADERRWLEEQQEKIEFGQRLYESGQTKPDKMIPALAVIAYLESELSLSNEGQLMRRITDWVIDGYGSIRGDLLNEDGEREKGIKTSRVVERIGNVVKTKSGNQYQLIEPQPIMIDKESLHRFFHGATDHWDAIDKRIASRDRREADIGSLSIGCERGRCQVTDGRSNGR